MSGSLREQMTDALRELANAHRAYRRGYAELAHVDDLPLPQLHHLQDAQHTVTELALQLYPEGS
jgi:hypothetical protein